jgi:hypothetical protein
MCRDLHLHRQDCSGYPGCDIHPPAPDPDSFDDNPEIGANACGEPAEGGRLICMMAPNGEQSHNSFMRYPTIGRSEASDAWTPSGGLVWNLNPDFNTVRVQAIMETIQRMAPDDSPLLS